jgi:hypothetical protein
MALRLSAQHGAVPVLDFVGDQAAERHKYKELCFKVPAGRNNIDLLKALSKEALSATEPEHAVGATINVAFTLGCPHIEPPVPLPPPDGAVFPPLTSLTFAQRALIHWMRGFIPPAFMQVASRVVVQFTNYSERPAGPVSARVFPAAPTSDAPRDVAIPVLEILDDQRAERELYKLAAKAVVPKSSEASKRL